MLNLRCTVLFLTVMLVFTAVSKSSADLSTKMRTFISLFLGKWTTYAEVGEDKIFNRPVHVLSVVTVFLFEVPALDSSHTLLFVEKINDIVNRVHVLPLTEDLDGNIRMRPYNLTTAGMERLRFDPSDPPRVMNFEPEELVESSTECDIVFVQIETNVFFGQWPNCRDKSPGEMQQYDTVMTCNKAGAFPPPGALESPNPLPYIGTRDNRFPALPKMLERLDNFTGPCTCS